MLTYANYIGLMSAIDEHTKYSLTRREIQNLIFKHFIKYGSFIAENEKEKALFYAPLDKKSKVKSERQRFIKFYATVFRSKGKSESPCTL